MKIKQKIIFSVISLFLMSASFFSIFSFSTVNAIGNECSVGSSNCCAGVHTAIISCSQSGKGNDVQNSGVWGLLILAINILTAGVGVAAIGGIVYGAILYTTAGGDQGKVKKAVTALTNVAIGIVAYGLMWSLLNFLIPGGVLH